MRWFTGITVAMLPGFLTNGSGVDLLCKTATGSHGRFEVADYIDLLREQNIQLWAMGEDETVMGIVLSEVIDYPRMRILRLFGLQGSGLSELIANLPIIKAWAVAQGCDEIGLEETRAGLELAVEGFERMGVCLRMPLDNVMMMKTAGAA